MSAGITYEGALQSSGGTATMFQGKRFWVARRIPTRVTWENYIKNNGGELVPLEKNADYMIADHLMKKYAPDGSISYSWIDESVKQGQLLDPAPYLINKPKATPPTEQQSKRTGRTAFTDEDDRILLEWVHEMAEKNEPLHGQAIYKKLAAKYPRHTDQSWRDRYVKRLRYLHEASAPQSPKQAAAQPGPVSQRPQADQAPAANQNMTPDPSRPSAAGGSARPSVPPKPSQPSTAAASPRPSATNGTRPSAAPKITQPKVTPIPSQRRAEAESPRPRAAVESPRPSVPPKLSQPSTAAASPRPSAAAGPLRPSAAPRTSQPSTAAASPEPSATVESSRPSAAPGPSRPSAAPRTLQPEAAPIPSKRSAAVKSPRPTATPEHTKPRAGVESSRPSAVPRPPKPAAAPEYVPISETPQLSRSSAAAQPPRPTAGPEFTWSSTVPPQCTPDNTVMRSTEPSSSWKRKSIFSEMEDELLIRYVLKKVEEMGQEAERSMKIYTDLEYDFPDYPARVWRHRWFRYLRPRVYPDEYQNSEGLTVTETPQASNWSNANPQPQVDAVRPSTPVPPTEPPSQPTTPETRSEKGKEVVRVPASDTQTKDSPRRTTSTSPAAQRQYRDDVSEPSLGAGPGYLDEEDADFVPSNDSSPSSVDEVDWQEANRHPSAEAPGYSMSESQRFHQEYQWFWDAHGDRLELPNFWPTIRGKHFNLFDLWKAATSQNDSPAERDWEQIAEKLNLDWVELDGVQHELADYYKEHLGQFEEQMASYDDGEESIVDNENDATPEAEVPVEQSETDVLDEAEPGPSRQPFNSSPPKLSSLKRPRDAASFAYPDIEPKRRKFDRSVEISSTPDHKNGTEQLRGRAVSAAVSPSDRRLSSLPRSSRSPEAIRQSMGSPLARGKRRAVAEPETQDFRYDPETQNIVLPHSRTPAGDQQSEADITVSQQITLESEGFVEVSSSPRMARKSGSVAHVSPLRRQVARDSILNNSDDKPPPPIPKPQFGKGRNPLLPAPAPTVTKKGRSLPWPKDQAALDTRTGEQPVPGPATAAGRPSFIRPPRSDEPSSPAARRTRTPGTAAEPMDDDLSSLPASCDPQEIKVLRSVLRGWEERGYARDVALRGLDATTWTQGLSDEMIALLQEGKPLPDAVFGVWTDEDDRRLAVVDGREPHPPRMNPERLAHRRDRALRRLLRKFDDNALADRRHWLTVKHALQEAGIQL